MELRGAARWLVLAGILIVAVGGAVILGRSMFKQRSTAAEKAPTWREELDGYVALLNQDDGRIVSVHETGRARFPERFAPAMSRYTWSDSSVFRSDHAAESAPKSTLRPLPFPPTELWCATLAYKYTTDPALNVPNDYEFVLIARHEAGNQAAWVAHRLAAQKDAAAMQQTLDEIGCSLTVK